MRPLVPGRNPATARLAIAAGVYRGTEDHLTAARIPPHRAAQRRHNNGHGEIAYFLARSLDIPVVSLADPAGSCLVVGEKRFDQKQPYDHRRGNETSGECLFWRGA